MSNSDVVDTLALTSVIAVWAQWLPEVAALLAILWGFIRIYEWARVRIFGYPPDGLFK